MLRTLLFLALLATASRGQCPSTWDATIGVPGANGAVLALATFDEGAGPRLFAAGAFTQVGGAAASRIARWDGATWSALGAGLDGPVHALAVYDDGSGRALYAGGSFAHAGGAPAANIARWNGTSWSALGVGVVGEVDAFAVHDDGAGFGTALFVGGSLVQAGGVPGGPLARWSAAGWSLALPQTGGILDMAVFDDGSGPRLYVCGGNFTTTTSDLLQRWNGSSWSDLPPGAPISSTVDDAARALCVWNDGTGSALYVGGTFHYPSGFRDVARFDGALWSHVGEGVQAGDYSGVNDLLVHDDGGGPALWATGFFWVAGGVGALSLARWNGAGWAAPAPGLGNGALAGIGDVLASHDDGLGRALFAGGSFDHTGVASRGIARWSAAGGLPVVSAPVGPTSATVGDVVQYSVTAAGPGPLTYTWRLPTYGGEISGGTTPTVTIQVVAPFEAGSYWAVVSGPCGQTESASISLSVSPGPGTPVCGCYALAPCGNPTSGWGQGCANSVGGSGWLAAQGSASVAGDTVVLLGANMTNSSVLYFQGTSLVGTGGAPFGDGVRCAGGTVVRLGVHANVHGASRHPGPLDPTLSAAGGLTGGETRIYQCWYRDAASYCTSASFNLTNGVRVTWSP